MVFCRPKSGVKYFLPGRCEEEAGQGFQTKYLNLNSTVLPFTLFLVHDSGTPSQLSEERLHTPPKRHVTNH